jgi:hypothetical protein
MKVKMTVTPDSVALTHDIVADVRDAEDAARHARAVARYREERKVAREPWWIDVGGEGGL